MKKTLPVFVLFLMLLNTAGYYIVYEFNRYLIRQEVTSLLEKGFLDHELSVLTIYDPPSDPAFRRADDHEIVYHGNLYDVAREVRKGKTVTFHCIRDTREENLIAGMNSMHQKKRTANLLQHLVTIALPVFTEQSHPQATKEMKYPLLSEQSEGRSEVPISPPPEIA